MKNTSVVLALTLVSASVLNFEVLLTRYIAIEHWHHLTIVIISIALLGFGAAGSLSALLSDIVITHYQKMIAITSGALVFSFPLAQLLAASIPFNMLAIPWNPEQYVNLLLYALCWFLPFFFAAFYISLTFMHNPERIPKLYGADLLGAALGVLLALVFLELDQFTYALLFSPMLALLAMFFSVRNKWSVLITGLTLLMLQNGFELHLYPKVNSFKEYEIRINEANVKKILQVDTPHARISVLATPGQHASPGQSINSTLTSIPQWQLFRDGDASVPLLLGAASKQAQDLLHQSLLAAPYQLLDKNVAVLLLGSNPSWNSWTAHWHRATSITLLDPNYVISTVENAVSDRQLDKPILPAQTRLQPMLPRQYMTATRNKFDLIVTSVGSNPIGNTADKLNFMMTTQGIRQVLARLTTNGVLAISNHMSSIPKDNLRVLNTVISLLREKALEPHQHIAVLRDWRTFMILVSNAPLQSAQITNLSQWSQRWRFDLVALPGLAEKPNKQYHIRNDVSYFDLIQQLMQKDNQAFIEQYQFELTPNTDNKPFLYHSLRWQKLEKLKHPVSQQWPLIIGWGYLLSFASLAILTLVAFTFILLPLIYKQSTSELPFSNTIPVIYFFGLGMGFMFIEIAFLKQASLLLDSETGAFATILSAVLIGTGLGSLTLGKLSVDARRLLSYIASYVLCLFLVFLLVPHFFELSVRWSELFRAVFVFLTLTCLSWPLGMLLPYGIHRFTDRHPKLIAWCWGINGFASVFGTLLAPLIAMQVGFSGLLLFAAASYFMAGLANLIIERRVQ